jgi:hypothetical protein
MPPRRGFNGTEHRILFPFERMFVTTNLSCVNNFFAVRSELGGPPRVGKHGVKRLKERFFPLSNRQGGIEK